MKLNVDLSERIHSPDARQDHGHAAHGHGGGVAGLELAGTLTLAIRRSPLGRQPLVGRRASGHASGHAAGPIAPLVADQSCKLEPG